MELTRFAKIILKNKVKKRHKVGLWVGIISLIAAIGIIFWTHKITQRVYSSFHDRYISIKEDISPKTELEIKLKGSLLNATKAAEEGWCKYSMEKGLRVFQIFFLTGILLIVNYFVHKIRVKK